MNIFSCPKSFSTLKCQCLHFYRINLPYVSIPFDTVLLCIQIPITYTATRWTLLYFPSSTKKDWYRSRAWWKIHNVQFTGAQVMVPYLVQEMDSLSAIMPTVTLIHAQTLVTTTTTYQVKYRTGKQSLLGLTDSHLMRWRCFISPESHDTENR